MGNLNFKTLEVSRDSRGVLRVALNRPELRNAFNEQMISELTQVFTHDVLEPSVRVVVLTGNGSTFSAGGDLNWMKKSIELSYEGNLDDTTRLTQMFKRMNECPKPLIGRIFGAAIGGGVGLTSVCDTVVATEDTVFSLSEVRLGIVPACIGPFVISKIGASHSRSYFLTAERFRAPDAYRIGLIHEVVKGTAELDERVEKIISQMLECGPNAMAAAKHLILSLSLPEQLVKTGDRYGFVATLLAKLRVTPEAQEGLKAFLEKRKPNWFKSS